MTLTSEDLTTLTGGTISVSAIDGVHTANIVILGQYSGAGFTTSVDNGGGTMVIYHDPHAIASLKERSWQKEQRELPLLIVRIAAVVTLRQRGSRVDRLE